MAREAQEVLQKSASTSLTPYLLQDWLSFATEEVRRGHAVLRGAKLALYLKKGRILVYTETTETA